MPASVELRDDDLVVHIHGWDRLRAMRGTVTVPLAHVVGARAQPPEAWFDNVIVNSTSGVGVYVPGKVAVGSLDLADGRSFYDVRDPMKAIAIDLQHEDYSHLVVELDDETPDEAVRRIESVFERGTIP